MNSIDVIKNKIYNLYKSDPNIHISISMTGPKINLNNEPAIITGVYSHIFQVQVSDGVSESTKRYSLQYSDVLTKQITIAELENG